MRIVCLTENTEGRPGCGVEHGLCFYIETAHHRLLFDTGASGLHIANAAELGVNLSAVDTVIISHGHYDHGGGLPAFLNCNSIAEVYMQKSALLEYYSLRSTTGEPRYIGLDRSLPGNERITLLDGDFRIDEELALFASARDSWPSPGANRTLLKKTDEGLVRDDFVHEMYLAVFSEGVRVLFSGCAHRGIRNILGRYRELYGEDPDAVFSGFHMMKRNGYSEEDLKEISDTALSLQSMKTQFYTCHCTGEVPYQEMKKIMAGQLNYIHCGDEVSF
ncbi:MAG: MBL fold metallo-hydrolase [Solobacterium sp.]|nr:MBL fold metallo-hydrolase [Solobacterium sp.]